MDCPDCGGSTVVFAVPDAFAEYAPVERASETPPDAVAVCTACLHLTPVGSPPETSPDPRQVSDALPGDSEAAVGLLLAVDLLDSLATNRPAVEALLEAVERRGVDPVLSFERLAADPELSPSVDLVRRSRQLEGLR